MQDEWQFFLGLNLHLDIGHLSFLDAYANPKTKGLALSIVNLVKSSQLDGDLCEQSVSRKFPANQKAHLCRLLMIDLTPL